MQKIQKHIDITAPREAVWAAVVERAAYERWTSAFCPGSTFVGGWNAGDSIRFLADDPEGRSSGMIAEIALAEYPSQLSIRMLGEVVDGVDDTTSERVRAWTPSYENYTFEALSSTRTRFHLDMEVALDYADMMDEGWDKALVLLKQVAEERTWLPARVAPCVWFNGDARQAAERYAEIFPNAYISEQSLASTESNEPLTVNCLLGKLPLLALNGGPMFSPTPAISIFVRSGSVEDLRRWWEALSLNSTKVLIDLQAQEWSPLYGWLSDAWGLTWQLMLDRNMTPDALPRFTPAMLFTSERFGSAEAALEQYASLIPDADLRQLDRYTDSPFAGKVLFAELNVPGGSMIAMDGPGEHSISFSEGVSLIVHCVDQAEIDLIWGALIADGGSPSQCGWLKDRFGVSWQVLPESLGELLSDPKLGPLRVQALMGMGKIELAELEELGLTQQTTFQQ